MKQKALQESYNEFLDNKISRAEFHKLINMNQFAKRVVSPVNSLDDAIKILKNKKMISEGIHFNFKSTSATNSGQQPATTNLTTAAPAPSSAAPAPVTSAPAAMDEQPVEAPVAVQPEAPVQEIKRINQPGYLFYVYSVDQGKLVAGNEYIEDARDMAKEWVQSGKGPAKVCNSKVLKQKFNLDPNDNASWGSDNGSAAAPQAEVSEEEENAKIADDIDQMLSEFRAQLQEEKPLQELSLDTVQQTSQKMADKGQNNRGGKLIDQYFAKYRGLALSEDSYIFKVNIDKAKVLTIDISATPLDRNHHDQTYPGIKYDPAKDQYDVANTVFIDRKGARILAKLASILNPKTKYLSGAGDLKIQGY